MPELKLSKLPDRNPVKITVTVQPSLNAALQTYAELYRENYGEEETVAELIPYMLQSFLDGDRSFAKAIREKEVGDEASARTSRRPARRNNAGARSETT